MLRIISRVGGLPSSYILNSWEGATRLLSRGGIVEEDGRRWKKMEEDGRRCKKMMEKGRKKSKTFFLSVGDHLGTLVGVRMAPQKINCD